MACFSPLSGYRSRAGPGIVFDRRESIGQVMEVPCGQCIGCRLDRSRMWAVRCVHEASLYDENCFVTLTYRDEDLPSDGSLNLVHFQDFMKRLRRFFSDRKIRFYHCGEYGDESGRPHYHVLLFNLDFPDKVFWSERNGNRYYRSAILEERWRRGMCIIGDVTFESAGYVARYVLKKITGDLAQDHYLRCDEHGEAFWLVPEYTTMSRRPGIGRGWYDLFSSEVFPSDDVVLNGALMRPPRFYADIFKEAEPEAFEVVKRKRIEFALEHSDDNTSARLRVREVVKRAQVGLLKRGLLE